jgi:hypothetical protein
MIGIERSKGGSVLIRGLFACFEQADYLATDPNVIRQACLHGLKADVGFTRPTF